MQNQKELVEYYFNEVTETAEFLYENSDGTVVVEARHQPLKVEVPDVHDYWAELLHYINTQGEV